MIARFHGTDIALIQEVAILGLRECSNCNEENVIGPADLAYAERKVDEDFVSLVSCFLLDRL